MRQTKHEAAAQGQKNKKEKLVNLGTDTRTAPPAKQGQGALHAPKERNINHLQTCRKGGSFPKKMLQLTRGVHQTSGGGFRHRNEAAPKGRDANGWQGGSPRARGPGSQAETVPEKLGQKRSRGPRAAPRLPQLRNTVKTRTRRRRGQQVGSVHHARKERVRLLRVVVQDQKETP